MKIQLRHRYEGIISLENMLLAWKEFLSGKKQKMDVQEFSLRLMDNILQVIDELASKTYRHGAYYAFNISDPKPRNIHKASVRDRLLHHALYRILYPYFDRMFIADSYSCRVGKGVHKALSRFDYFFNKVSRNNTRTCWVLKCDIRKFFASVDHSTLKTILKKYIPDQDILWLLENIISSFESTGSGKGLPLGNLTSQLLVNIYMNDFDQWMKHELKAKYYIRYADDFVILHEDKSYLEEMIHRLDAFLTERLQLSLHPNKIYIKTVSSGVDFLGWVHFPHHRVLRTSTKRKMFRTINKESKNETIQSYLGVLSHGNAFKLSTEIKSRLD
jgi:retron-type reverse transcriptase